MPERHLNTVIPADRLTPISLGDLALFCPLPQERNLGIEAKIPTIGEALRNKALRMVNGLREYAHNSCESRSLKVLPPVRQYTAQIDYDTGSMAMDPIALESEDGNGIVRFEHIQDREQPRNVTALKAFLQKAGEEITFWGGMEYANTQADGMDTTIITFFEEDNPEVQLKLTRTLSDDPSATFDMQAFAVDGKPVNLFDVLGNLEYLQYVADSIFPQPNLQTTP